MSKKKKSPPKLLPGEEIIELYVGGKKQTLIYNKEIHKAEEAYTQNREAEMIEWFQKNRHI